MYMLDTDTCSYVLRTKSIKLRKKFEAETGNIAMSEVVLAELRYGAENHQRQTDIIHDLIDGFTARLEILPWTASTKYGEIRAILKKSDVTIGNLDTLIAAHALQQHLILVTSNTADFGKVPHLKITNWI